MNITNLPKNIILYISTFLTSKYILRTLCRQFRDYIPVYRIESMPKNIILYISTFLTSKYILRTLCKQFHNYMPIYEKETIPEKAKKVDILDLSNTKLFELPEVDILKIKSSHMFMYKFPKYIRRLIIDKDSGYRALTEVEQIDELIIETDYSTECNWAGLKCFNKLKFVEVAYISIKDDIDTKIPIVCKSINIQNDQYMNEVFIDTITCMCFQNNWSYTNINNLNIIYNKEIKLLFEIDIESEPTDDIIDTLTFIGFQKREKKIIGLQYVKNINFENCSEEFITYINKLKN